MDRGLKEYTEKHDDYKVVDFQKYSFDLILIRLKSKGNIIWKERLVNHIHLSRKCLLVSNNPVA